MLCASHFPRHWPTTRGLYLGPPFYRAGIRIIREPASGVVCPSPRPLNVGRATSVKLQIRCHHWTNGCCAPGISTVAAVVNHHVGALEGVACVPDASKVRTEARLRRSVVLSVA